MNILLVEDHAGTREALTALLRLGGHAASGFATGHEAIAAAPATPGFEAAVVDLMLPDMAGPDVIRKLREARPALPVLVLTVFEDRALILEAVRAGASGYLLKGSSLDEVSRAVEQVAGGLSPLSAEVARHLLDHVNEPAPPDEAPREKPSAAVESLSEQERRVFERLVRGHSYGAIAKDLGLGIGTVQTYVKRIYRKLAVNSKAEAAWLARGSEFPAPS